ncbi:MAG: cyclase family protein [Planctomycetota bacterium]|jgi:kynurenine formamidase
MSRFVDLSLDLFEGMRKFPGAYHAPFKSEITGTFEKDKCRVHRIELATHTGTHIDAPMHFIPGGETIDRVPLERLVCTAKVLDLTHKGGGSTIDTADVEPARTFEGEGLLLKTGWYHQWDTGRFYEDFPVLTEEAAKQLIDRGVEFLAVDIPLSHEVHVVVLGAGKILIENLTNLDAVRAEKVRLIALPLKFRAGDAAPARVVAEMGE